MEGQKERTLRRLRFLDKRIWTAVALAWLLALAGRLPAPAAQRPQATPATQTYRLYFPALRQPYHLFVPAFLDGALSNPSAAPDEAVEQAPAQVQSAGRSGPQMGFVSRHGQDLELDGRPYTFIGANVSYLAGPFFPEDKAVEMVPGLAANGVQVVRVWVEPWCDLDRVERLLDLGAQYGLRFLLTLQDFYGHEDGWWFKGDYETDLRHIRSIVPRFAQRPEVLMWELMNEPTCPAKDAGQDCWDAFYRWVQVTSSEIRRLDPNHLISVGTQRAGFVPGATEAFRRIHTLDSIDAISLHGEVGKLGQGEFEQELAIAHELGKPVYLGELYMRGHNESCLPLADELLQRRAEAIATDITQTREAGVDGYLLWEYEYRGGVDMGSHIQYFCGVYGYFHDDPVWEVVRAAAH
jgi:hypothetical protein